VTDADPGPGDAGLPDASTCGTYTTTPYTLDGGCATRYERQCGIITFGVFCKCPAAKCDCEKFGYPVSTVPYSGGCGSADSCQSGLAEAYAKCKYP
jgi:hypothetical protein